MPETGFIRPTLAELIARISSDLNSRLTGRDSRIRRSLLWVLARVLAGAVHLLYGFAAWIARQVFPDTAEEEALRRHAAIWGLEQLPAVQALHTIALAGTPAAVLAAGAILQRSDGAEFELQADATIGLGGTASGQVEALLAGEAGACDIGTELELASPSAGITSIATVSATVTDGADAEGPDALRVRLLAYIARRPQGGALADYDTWTRAALLGVARVFVSPLELGPGTVVVRFSVTGAGAAAIPDAGQVAAVQAYLDVAAPVTAAVTVAAPVGHPVAMTIHVTPDTPAIRLAVVAELEDLFSREAEPGGTLPNSHLREAISRATGEGSHTLAAVDGGAGTADVVQGTTEIAYPGVITWI